MHGTSGFAYRGDMRATLAMVVASAVLGACAGDDGGGGGDGGCAFAGQVSGALTATFTAGDPVTCSAATDLGGDPIIVFYPTHATIMRFDLTFDAAVANMTGAVVGDLAVITKSGAVWESDDCAYNIERWDGIGGQQKLAGNVTCAMPAQPDTGSQTVMFGPVLFDM
jgi:hypothetical protein